MDTPWFWLSLLLMLVGVAGTILPGIPGLPLVLAGPWVYAVATGFSGGIGFGHLALFTLVGGAGIAAGLLANVFGARMAGGTKWGAIGAVVGLVAGLFLGGPVGLLVGPFLGAFALEMLAVREARLALRSGLGATIGVLASTALELAIAIGLVGAYLVSVLVR